MQANHVVLYTTGAYLVPKQVVIDDQEVWAWIVNLFEDDSFLGNEVFNPPEKAETVESLVVNTTDMDAPTSLVLGGFYDHRNHQG